MFRHSLLVAIVLVGCKSKREAPAKQASPAPVAPNAVAGAQAPAPKPGEPKGLLAAGSSPLLGCFAWNAATKTAACIGGTRSHAGGENDLSLDILDGRPSIRLSDPLDAETATRNNGVLAGFEKITRVAAPLFEGKPVAVTKGLSLTMTVKAIQMGGDGEPPTTSTSIQATCGKGKAAVFSLEDEGSTVAATTRVFGDVVIVETINRVSRQGEAFETAEAARIDVATCQVTRSGGQ